MLILILWEHNRTEEPTDENIPLDPVTPGRSSILEPECDQEMSFGGRSCTSVLQKEYLVGEIYELIGNKTHQRLEPNLSLFVLGEDGRLYYKGKPLMNGKWRAKNYWHQIRHIGNQRTSRDGLQHSQS